MNTNRISITSPSQQQTTSYLKIPSVHLHKSSQKSKVSPVHRGIKKSTKRKLFLESGHKSIIFSQIPSVLAEITYQKEKRVIDGMSRWLLKYGKVEMSQKQIAFRFKCSMATVRDAFIIMRACELLRSFRKYKQDSIHYLGLFFNQVKRPRYWLKHMANWNFSFKTFINEEIIDKQSNYLTIRVDIIDIYIKAMGILENILSSSKINMEERTKKTPENRQRDYDKESRNQKFIENFRISQQKEMFEDDASQDNYYLNIYEMAKKLQA